jgi:hypothetical protein
MGDEVEVSDSIFESRVFFWGLAVAINHYLSRLSCYATLLVRGGVQAAGQTYKEERSL